MRKRWASVALMVSVIILLTAMGGKGGGFEKAPRVDKNFMVVVTDASGNKLEGEKFSWEGRIHFAGYLGLAQVTMPFERVKELTVGEKKDRKVKVTALLTDGTETVFEIDSDSRVYGESRFGSFMLTMDEIKSISFKGIK
ncbi:MAG TPA: hypothetical protein VL087_06655 [Nitrospirota bacterium]|nr:hypothetical protein [Nitrospirota bacterium]